MSSFELKNTIAKVIIIAWIACLLAVAAKVAVSSVTFNVNSFFALSGDSILPDAIVREVKVIFLMLSVAIVGGVAFMIKDFYRSVKYANVYNVAYGDYVSGHISNEEFQRLVTLEIYTGRFNHTWVYWFFIQPVLSSALGIIAFFIARSGLWVLQGTSANGDLTIQSIYMYAVFTFLAGFSSHKFIAWLDRLADKIFSTTLPEQKEESKAKVLSAASMDRVALKSEVESEDRLMDAIETSDQVSEKREADQTGFAKLPMKSIR